MAVTNLLLLNRNAGENLLCSLKSILAETASIGLRITEETVAGTLGRGNARIVRGRQQPSLILLCLEQQALHEAESLCQSFQEQYKNIPIVLVTESAEPRQLCSLLKQGAADFLLSPLRSDDVIPRIMRLVDHTRESNSTIRSLQEKLGLQQFIGESEVLMAEIAKIPKVAQCGASVLISGETGTGKEMVARAIHYLSPRSKAPFIPINCGAIPIELMENELFGHEAGAFTGATSSISGMIHDSDGGSLFLDEIDSLTPSAQVKLLRFLQDKEYRPLGSRKVCRADVRVIAASNINFEDAVRAGKLRSDLYYRLNVIPICLPPLRKRKEDVPSLARHFLAKYSVGSSANTKRFSSAALAKFRCYDWPGNVRELENVVQRAAILSTQTLITGEDICLPAAGPTIGEPSFKSLKAKAVAEFEAGYIRQFLAAHDGNITRAAAAAKKNRRAFWQLMRKHQIVPDRSVSC